MADYEASIALVGAPDSTLRGTVSVSLGVVEIRGGGQSIGSWPLAELGVSRTGDEVLIDVEGEQLRIEAVDPDGLARALGAGPAALVPTVSSALATPASDGAQGRRWWRFWDVDVWRQWATDRRAWRQHQKADDAVPAVRRPVSPAWVPGVMLAVLLVAVTDTPSTIGADLSDEDPSTSVTEVPDRTEPVPSEVSTTTTASTTTTLSDVDDAGEPALLAFTPGPSGDPGAAPPDGSEAVEVVSITDGDTLTVRRADGSTEAVRLIGINSPEGGECLADVAGAALGALAPVGSTIHLTVDVSETDQFDRLLRYVWVGSASVNEEMVRRGMAIARRYPPDTALAASLEAAQADARASGTGIWAAGACGTASDATIRIVELNFDAPGDDNVNRNEEWITLRNLGDGPVDLTGWSLRDESATNRYEFPAGFTLGPGETVTVRSGCGTDFSTNLHWCNEPSAVWNNDGDTAFVIDPSGNIHTDWSYRPATTTTAAPTTTTTRPTTTTAAPTTTLAPTTTAAANCHPSYPDVCIPPPPPDLDCGEISHRNFRVTGSDPHRFDGDNDGIGCET